MNRRVFLAVMGIIGWLTCATSASAVIVIDGVRDAEYGARSAMQDTPTRFGDNQNELAAAYARQDASGNVYLMLAGNMQNQAPGGGSNKLVVFVDSRAGGAVETVREDMHGILGSFGGAQTDDWGTDTDGSEIVNSTPGGGSILDPTFNPDVAIVVNIFDGTYYTSIIDMTLPNHPDSNPERDIYLGSNDPLLPAETGPATAVTQMYDRAANMGDGDVTKGHGGTIQHAFDNTNVNGVYGWNNDTPPGELGFPLSAKTGYEALISAAFLANDGQPNRLMAFITNDSGNFLSNQFLGEAGGVGGLTNLAGPGGDGGVPLFDASLFAGNQFFTVPTATGVPGDFNGDAKVDAADYVVWRKYDGTQAGYDELRSNFGTGAGAGGGIGSAAAVPEPASALLVVLGLVAAVGMARRK